MAATTNAIAVVDRTIRTSLPRIDFGRRRNSGRRNVWVSLIGRSLWLVDGRPAARISWRAVSIEVRRSWVDAAALHPNRDGQQFRADLQADPVGRGQRHLKPNTPIHDQEVHATAVVQSLIAR